MWECIWVCGIVTAVQRQVMSATGLIMPCHSIKFQFSLWYAIKSNTRNQRFGYSRHLIVNSLIENILGSGQMSGVVCPISMCRQPQPIISGGLALRSNVKYRNIRHLCLDSNINVTLLYLCTPAIFFLIWNLVYSELSDCKHLCDAMW